MRKLIVLAILLAGLQPVRAQVKPNADSITIRNTITGFYNWYTHNYQKLEQFHLYESIRKKDNPPYRINWKTAEQYFGYLRSHAPQLGEAFITELRSMLKQSDSAFKKDPEDEMPFNFDYDWYTNSQEDPQWLVDELRKSKQWATVITGNEAKVDVLGTWDNDGKIQETVVMCFVMKKEKGKWKIAHIGCPYLENPNP